MPMFDTYVMVDWSAKNRKTTVAPQGNAIWWAVQPAPSDDADLACRYERTRTSAIENLSCFLKNEMRMERRVLVGFDFAFGYPAGFVELITRHNLARTLWRQLSGERDARAEITIHDDERNKNNRFEVAAKLNGLVTKAPRPGPFWGHIVSATDPYAEGREWPFKFNRLRVTDALASGAKSVFQLHGTGSVGSQVLTGLPCLYRLWKEFETQAVVWPFDTCFEAPNTIQGSHRIVIVEIYPSLLGDAIERHREPNEIVDRAQVRLNALAFSLLDKENELGHLFLGPRAPGTTTSQERPSLSDIRREEGWIFGVDQKSYNKYRLLCALMEYFRSQEKA